MEPKNALGKQYKKMFSMNDVSWSFHLAAITPIPLNVIFSYSFTFKVVQAKFHITEEALRLIARKAMVKNTGARGLRSILEAILTEAMYEVL